MVHDSHQGDQSCTTVIDIETLRVLVPKSIGKSVLKKRYLCIIASSSGDSDYVFARVCLFFGSCLLYLVQPE